MPSYIYTNASVAYRLSKGLVITSQLQYGYKQQEIISARCVMEKYFLSKGVINAFLEKNFKSNTYGMGMSISYDFSFARLGFSARNYNDRTTYVQSARGSFMYSSQSRYLEFGNRSVIGRGGISFIPFLDMNGNGRREEYEPKVKGLKVQMNSGRIVFDKNDTLIQVLDLEPYINHHVTLNQNNFENAAWEVRYKTLSASVKPNSFQLIEVPVMIRSELSGRIYNKNRSDLANKMHFRICFYRADGSLAGYTFTEPNGSYNTTSLSPGTYTVSINKDQLEQLQLKSSPQNITVTLKMTTDGDIAKDIDFTVE